MNEPLAMNGNRSEIVRCFTNMVRLHHCWKRVMCASNNEFGANPSGSFSAVADLLFNGKEDFLRSFRHVVIQTRLSDAPQHFGICLLEAALTPKQNAEDAKLRTGFSPWTFCRRWPRPSGRRSHAEVLVQTR